MAELPSWNRWLRIGREASAWGTAPTDALEYNMNGGSWHSVITTSPLGALKYPEVKHRTKGATGQRTMDQHASFDGGHHSEGALDLPVDADLIGLLLRTALGSDSVADTSDTTITTGTTVDASPKTMTLDAQPTSGKYDYLKCVLTMATPGTTNAGTIVVTGTDPNDATISETIVTPALTATQVFTVYTKLAFKTITSIVYTGWATGTGTMVITGIQYTTHTISCADTSGSLAIEEFGDPGAGSGKSWLYTGMTISQLSLVFSALDEAGLFVATPTLQGKFPTALTSTTYRIPLLLPWASWVCSATKGGSAYSQIQNLNININTGSRVYRAAVGSQNPQGKLDAARTVELSGQLWLADNTEYTAWKNNTLGNYVFTFQSPYKVGTSTYQNLVLTFSETDFLTMEPAEVDGMIVANFTGFIKANSSTNAIQAVLINQKNGTY